MNQFEDHVAACCDGQLDEKDRNELSVAGFSFAFLVPVLIQVLADMMIYCFKKANSQEIAAMLAKGYESNQVRHAAWIAAGRAMDSSQPKVRQMKIARGLCEACSTASDAQRVSFVASVKEVSDPGFLI